MKKHRYCFDIDKTILFWDKNYNNCTVDKDIKRLINSLHMSGHTIILHTARKMKTYKGNVRLARKSIEAKTKTQLEFFGIMYDEIYFGKPSADIYIDDKGINILNIKGSLTMDDQKIDKLINSMGLLEYKIDQLNETVDKTNKNREQIIVLNTKLEQIDSSVRDLKELMKNKHIELGKVQISIAKIMTWGTMGGGIITIVIELLKDRSVKMAIDPNNLNDKIVLNRIANLEERM